VPLEGGDRPRAGKAVSCGVSGRVGGAAVLAPCGQCGEVGRLQASAAKARSGHALFERLNQLYYHFPPIRSRKCRGLSRFLEKNVGRPGRPPFAFPSTRELLYYTHGHTPLSRGIGIGDVLLSTIVPHDRVARTFMLYNYVGRPSDPRRGDGDGAINRFHQHAVRLVYPATHTTHVLRRRRPQATRPWQRGQVRAWVVSQRSTQAAWKRWPQGRSTRRAAPAS
jgi:hypothetical protein